jgi:diacylglycerol kinase (ATP)
VGAAIGGDGCGQSSGLRVLITPSSPQRSAHRIDSFRHAFRGWWYVIRTQENAWIHAVASIGAVIVGLWVGISALEWAAVLLSMSIVWVAEFFNTALESVVDLASPDIHPLAKVSKDVAAAGVLVGAGTALLIGLLILGPPLLERVLRLVVPLFSR